MSLTLDRVPRGRSAPSASAGSRNATPVSVLLVDDEPKNLVALKAVLAHEGLNLVLTNSGPEALKQLLQEDFAVVLLDVHMPGMDGFETAELIRGRERSRTTPIIFLTAAIRGDAQIAKGYQLGAVDYILKPFEPDILRSKVAVFAELFRMTDQVKRQAGELAQATTLLDGILQASREYAITALAMDGTFQVWNEGARQVYGYTSAETVGPPAQHLSMLSTPEDRAAGRLDRLLETALQTGMVEETVQLVRKDGREFTASMVVDQRLSTAGHPLGYVCIFRDITDRIRAEEERRRLSEERAARSAAEMAQRRFAFLADASDVLSSSLDTGSTLQAVARLSLPLMADACIVDLLDEDGAVQRVAAAVAPPHRAPVTRRLRAHTPSTDSSSALARVLRKGERSLQSSVTAAYLKALASDDARYLEVLRELKPRTILILPLLARGRTLGAMTFVGFQDSEQAYAPEDVAFAEDLAHRVAQAVDNSRLYAEAQAAVRVRDEFLSSATHDLKTPLTVIKAQAQLLHRRAQRGGGPDAEKIMEEASRIGVATAKMVGLVDQMLDVAALQMGRPLELRFQEMDLAQLAREVAAELAEPRGRHKIRVEAPPEGVPGSWDAARIERVLSNLLSNAIKYSPAGGEIVVSVKAERDEQRPVTVLRVRDPGVGIPTDELSKVFERFYRGRNVIGKIAGTGIGLAGVRQIVEEHGGQIGIESEENRGTTVVVTLPLTPQPPKTTGRARAKTVR